MPTRSLHSIIQQLGLLLLIAIHLPLQAGQSPVDIDDAWIAEAPPMSRVMVAYMTFTNHSDKPVTLVKAESGSFKSVEFHETVEKDGIASMIYHESLTLPAGSRLALKRGGLHLMLFSPTRALRAGDTVSFRFTTTDGQVITQNVKVHRR